MTWSDAVTQTGVLTSPAMRSVSPASTTTYTVTALVDVNCTALPGDLTGSATVTVNPRPTSVVSGSTTICPGGSANLQAALTGTGPWSVQWSDEGSPDTVLSSPAMRTVSPGATTTYTVTALSDANCAGLPGDSTGSAVVTVDACVPPTLTDVSYSGTTFTLSFLSQSGHTYDVEYKDSLDDPSWTFLETDPGTGSVITVTDSSATPGTRFYRVVCVCP